VARLPALRSLHTVPTAAPLKHSQVRVNGVDVPPMTYVTGDFYINGLGGPKTGPQNGDAPPESPRGVCPCSDKPTKLRWVLRGGA
jgi:hypothetical protein